MKLYGRNPVLERLKANPKSIRKIYLTENQGDESFIRRKASAFKIPVVSVPHSQMVKIGRSLNTQGVLAEVEDFNYAEFDKLLETALAQNHTILFLDNLNDPQNLGVIIRSAASLGGFAIVLPARESVEVTEAVLRVASGTDSYMTIAQVNNLSQAIIKAKEKGYWVAGAVVEGGKNIYETSLPFPLSLVLGSEQKGIREGVRNKLDLQIMIPMAHQRLSLNVAQAATIFCYEITRQKKLKAK